LKVFKSHIISRLTYARLVWSQLKNYFVRSKLRSVYFNVIRILVRDFELQLNRKKLLSKCSLERLYDILIKKNPMFIFKLTRFIEPAALAGTFLSKAYVHDRTPDKMIFFDTTRTRIGRSCITNLAKNIAESWTFDWIGLPILTFKNPLLNNSALYQTDSQT